MVLLDSHNLPVEHRADLISTKSTISPFNIHGFLSLSFHIPTFDGDTSPKEIILYCKKNKSVNVMTNGRPGIEQENKE